jgi:hypothetical protein
VEIVTTARNDLPFVGPLLDELNNAPQGTLEGPGQHKVMKLLANCWHEFRGAGETAMNARKLIRAEDISWNPPVLSFTIERHGAAVLGSTRAELQCWSVDLVRGTAHCEHGKYRQLIRPAPRLDVKPIATRVRNAVQQGPASNCDLVKMKIVVWKNHDTVFIKHGALISGKGYAQTVAGRRRRFRNELTDQMQNIGWRLESVQRAMTFIRVQSE